MIVAVTGVILILFIIGHLLGNLQVYLGPEWMNSYAQHLRDLGVLLWAARIGLLVAVLLHIWFTIQLNIDNKRARPEAYRKKEHTKATFASRHMVMSGLIILAFVIYHLAHFTWQIADPRFRMLRPDALGRHDVYSMLVLGFQNPIVSAFYIIAMFLLFLHLAHGASSFFQSLGLNSKRLTPRLAFWARVFAWLVFLGFASMPIACLLGWVKPAQVL